MRMDLEMKNTSNSDCTHCTIVVSLEMSDEPKKTLEASDIMSFPWEKEQRSDNEVKMDKEETLRRYREAKAAAGLK